MNRALPGPGPDTDLGRRVEVGRCRWITPSPEYAKAAAELQKSDPYAWETLAEQIEASQQAGGLRVAGFRQPGDYRCPLEYAPKDVVAPPWIGEFKANGNGKKPLKWPKTEPMWRLYFGEPVNERRAIVAVSLLRKWTASRQRGDVAKSMKLLKAHFGHHGHTWAPFSSAK